MKNPPAYVRLLGTIPFKVPFGAIGVVDDIDDEKEEAFVIFQKYDVAVHLPIYGLHFIDPMNRRVTQH